MLPYSLKIVGKDTLQSIHEQSLQLLSNAGVVFDNEEIVRLFVDNGQKVDGKRVYLSETFVMKALESVPRGFTMTSRNGTVDVTIGEKQGSLVVAPGNGTLFIQDIEGQRRRATIADFDNITKLCEHSRNVSLVGSIPVDPVDLPIKSKPARLVHHLMQYSNKPLIGQAATLEEVKQVFDIIEIAMGQKGFLDNNVTISYGVNPASPLVFEPLTCETMQGYAERKQALFILPGLMPGLTGPMDFKGLVVLSNAENLAAIACAQMLNPGTPVVYSAGTFMVNMKNFYAITGSPQSTLVNIAGIQMAREYYGLPSRTMAGLTDAKQVDFQAGAETMQNLALYTMAGVHVINECLGVMDSITTTSYEKWILDDELLDRLRVFSAGIDQVAAENTLDEMILLGPGGDYLQQPSTFQNCRSLYMPEISDWNTFEDWEKAGKRDVLQIAREKCDRILQERQPILLPAEVDQEITAYFNTI
ncbi:MAG: trimethylamine methyltransferase family protein [Deltaproteobacteria bacterium]|nr:trimethylamine methyltransferase family protein [Deltaproteobacteria bacterium]